MQTLDIIIPVYNSAKTLPKLLEELLNVSSFQKYDLGIILINDGSVDSSLEVCRTFAASNPKISVVDLMKNYGQHPAIFAGINISQAELIVTMDDDGQHLPSTVPLLLAELTSEIDIVYGVAAKDEHSWFRNLLSKQLKSIIFRGLGIQSSKKTSAFRAIRSDLFREVNWSNLSSGILEVAVSWNTTRIKAIEVPMERRKVGKSNYSIYKLLKFAIAMLISYSIRPLRVATVLGFVGFAFGLTLTTYYFFASVVNEVKVEGFATLAILISFFGSIQLITLGIIGEYLGKVHERNIGKPQFVIRSITSSRKNK